MFLRGREGLTDSEIFITGSGENGAVVGTEISGLPWVVLHFTVGRISHLKLQGLRTLSVEDQISLQENGFLVVKDFCSEAKCEEIRGRLNTLIDDFDPETSSSIFTTHESDRDLQDRYFLDSGDKVLHVRFFWEADAFEEDGKTLRFPKRECINKVGHALHVYDDVFKGKQQPSTTTALNHMAIV
eukprot:jgi/Bigna1/71052/fgenesh1_pg.14_\